MLLDTLNWKHYRKYILYLSIHLFIFTKMTGTWATKEWKSCGVLKNEVINVQVIRTRWAQVWVVLKLSGKRTQDCTGVQMDNDVNQPIILICCCQCKIFASVSSSNVMFYKSLICVDNLHTDFATREHSQRSWSLQSHQWHSVQLHLSTSEHIQKVKLSYILDSFHIKWLVAWPW